MEACSLYDNDNLLLKNEARVPYTSDDDLESLWLQDSSNHPSFHCIQSSASSMVNFEDVNNTTQKPSFKKNINNASKVRNSEEAIFDAISSQKKRRLSADQVHFLEKSFDVDNKLEPDRKVQLAKELGLQPRQVAIWFQNRRARFKTKLLQKDYDVLKSSYDCLKRDYDALFSENEKLKNEINMLTEKLLASSGNGSDQPPKKEPCSDDSIAQSDAKQSNTSSAKSDVMDSDSPRCCTTDGIHSTTKMMLEIERGYSSNAFEAAAETTISEGDSLSKSLFLQAAAAAASSSCFPKLEVAEDEYSVCYDNDLQPNSNCNLGFPVQNHGTWFWQI